MHLCPRSRSRLGHFLVWQGPIVGLYSILLSWPCHNLIWWGKGYQIRLNGVLRKTGRSEPASLCCVRNLSCSYQTPRGHIFFQLLTIAVSWRSWEKLQHHRVRVVDSNSQSKNVLLLSVWGWVRLADRSIPLESTYLKACELRNNEAGSVSTAIWNQSVINLGKW